MGEAFLMGRGMDPLNFTVRTGRERPETPRENTIYIETAEECPNWVMAPENPYRFKRDEDLLEGVTIAGGYFTSSGTISPENAERAEVYTVEQIPVECGKKYTYSYALSQAKSQWLVICEYKNGVFSKRIATVNAVEGSEVSGTYTPSDTEVTSVRLSWRTYHDSGCRMTFVEPDVEYTTDEAQEGMIWIQTADRGTASFSALRKNMLVVRMHMIWQYIRGIWRDMPAWMYQGGEWKKILGEIWLYREGDLCELHTGGWTAVDGAVTFAEGYMKVSGSNKAVLYTINPIDMTAYSILRFCLRAGSTQNPTTAGAGMTAEKDGFLVSCEIPGGTKEYTTFDIDVSALTGSYVVKIQTSAPAEGCLVQSVMLIR